MDKAALGQKRRCLNCSSPFFDLNRTPIVCPKCEAVFQIVEPARSPPRRAFKSPAPVASSEDDRVLLAEDEEDADLPFKSAEAQEDAEDSDDVEDVEAEA